MAEEEESQPPDGAASEQDLDNALYYLKTHSAESGESLYDHLSEVLAKVLSHRPRDALGGFEEYNKKLKDSRYKTTKGHHIRDVYPTPELYERATKIMELFEIKDGQDSTSYEDEEEEKSYDQIPKKPSLANLFVNFEKNGVSLSRPEILLIDLSFRKFMTNAPIENVRFWGKILGTPKNYYVMEATLTEEELNRRLEEENNELVRQKELEESKRLEESQTAIKDEQESLPKSKNPSATETSINDGECAAEKPKLEFVFPPLPKRNWQPEPEIPAEKLGVGANSKVYYICTDPGIDSWVELPMVTPKQIVIARQITRFFTGNLENPIETYPPFPGNEKNYLRAQIARIGAATLISPIGYFTFGGSSNEDEDEEELMDDEDDDEEEEEEINEGKLIENPNYEPLPLKDLIDPLMSNWCHHSPYLLKQGRVEWWDPKSTDAEKQKDEEDEDEEEEEDEELDEREESDLNKDKGPKKEIGPSLLTPLSEDAASEAFLPWTVRQSTIYQPDVAVAFVRSNTWPGAYAFARGKEFGNVYIGWGRKHSEHNYSPPPLPMVQDQYKIGPEIMEASEPIDELEEFGLSQLSKELSGEEEEEDEECVDDDEDDED